MNHLARKSRVQQDTAALASSSSSGAEAIPKRESHASDWWRSARDHGESYEYEAAAP